MHVLVLTTVLPGGRRGGGEVVTQGVVDALRGAGWGVRVLGYRRPEDSGPDRAGELCVGRRPIESASARARSLGWMSRALAGRSAYSEAKYRSRSYLRAAADALGEGPDAVIVDHAQCRFAIRAAGNRDGPLVFVAHNAEGDAYARLAAEARSPLTAWVNRREARLIRSAELELARAADQVWTLTQEDAEYFRSLEGSADVRTLEVASAVGEPAGAAAPVCDVGLIGTWSWRANALGLDWFLAEVVPRLPAALTVEVAGPGSERIHGRHSNVAGRGVVPDAARFLAGARVVAVPAVAGGGVQVKTLDAIASGVPVVATGLATRGLGDLPESVAVADEPADFARELARFAAESERERPRPEALAWSRARRERLEACVTEWIARPGPAQAGAAALSRSGPAGVG